MSKCTYCNAFILFRGRRDETGRYCSDECQVAGDLLSMSHTVAERDMKAIIREVHTGPCPCCGGDGPVDMHRVHKIWSLAVVSFWSSSPKLMCKKCATKRQIGAMVFSGLLGWWGLPWGVIMTPLQIVRNLNEIWCGPKQQEASPLLERYVRIQTVAAVIERKHRPQVTEWVPAVA